MTGLARDIAAIIAWSLFWVAVAAGVLLLAAEWHVVSAVLR